MDIGKIFVDLAKGSGFANMSWGNLVMIILACFFLFLGIKKKFEPLLLVGIAFGMLLTNLPVANQSDLIYHPEWWIGDDAIAHGVNYLNVLQHGGLLDIL